MNAYTPRTVPSIAVLLPCYNEASTIVTTIKGFQTALPQARIYVYDNNSSDRSADLARDAGAIVRIEPRQGKGHVMRRMFADIDADVYLMCDADDTYDVTAAAQMIEALVSQGLDMVVGSRRAISDSAYRPAHRFGNWMLTTLVRKIFGDGFCDMLSGYRIFSNRFVKSFPAMSQGFEIETELTIHALQLKMPVTELPTNFKERPLGSLSKLRTVSDGVRILLTILALLKQERPLLLFHTAAEILTVLALILAYPLLPEYLATGLVPRLPTAVLATGTLTIAVLCLFSGLILDTVTRGRHEAKRLRYLALPGIHSVVERRSVHAI